MGNSASSLPYTIGKQVSSVNHGWALSEGARKSDGANVSVFTAKKAVLAKTPVDRSKNPNLMELTPAVHHFMNCKKLRHPYILAVYATLDTDHPSDANNNPATAVSSTSSIASQIQAAYSEAGEYLIVTEPCVTLATWLASSPPLEQVAWGLECVVRSLHFLHASANLSHGNVSPESFYVTPAGDVKLWNFSLACIIGADGQQPQQLPQHFIDYEALLTPQSYRSPERVEKRYTEVASSVHAMDSYGVSVLMQHFFNNHLPAPLVKAVQRMQTPNIRMRPRLQPLLNCPIFETPYQKLQLQLETLAVQPVEEKIAFWQTLLPQLQAKLIPDPVVMHKLLPMMKASIMTVCTSDVLKQQEVYRKEVLVILSPLYYVGQTYLVGNSFSNELGAITGLLFQIHDRGIRGNMLQKAELLAENLDSNTLNQAVFEPMCSGFSDVSAALRELTLKATLVLLPKLTHPNLEKLSRYLVRLQTDNEAAIRTNTIIYFGKLAPFLTDIGRNKLLLPAFVRSMKDPFAPCRLEALRFANKVKQYFDPPSIAGKVLPALTPYLLDASIDVRRECFQVVDDLLFIIRQEGEKMPAQPDEVPINAPTYSVGFVPNNAAPVRSAVAPPQAPSSAPMASQQQQQQAPSSGGYLSGLSSWMTSSAKPTTDPATAAAPTVPQRAPIVQTSSAPIASTGPALTRPAVVDVGWEEEDDVGSDGDGWGNDSGMMNDSFNHHDGASVQAASGGTSQLFGAAQTQISEDDIFNALDMKPAKPAARLSSAPKGKLAIPSKSIVSTKPVVAKLAVTKLSVEDDVDDGWDDF
ncbi:hypothetical protein MPSEU_000549000 [Mayamaea pseudoterrestris]|nr:hypothetical protein MPSEU_000549000 [Mayamaea pseudoterrestris]